MINDKKRKKGKEDEGREEDKRERKVDTERRLT